MFRGYNEHSTIAYTINAVLTLTVYALTSRQPKRSWRGQTLADGVPAFCQKRAPRPLYVQHGLRPRTSREGAHDISVPPPAPPLDFPGPVEQVVSFCVVYLVFLSRTSRDPEKMDAAVDTDRFPLAG